MPTVTTQELTEFANHMDITMHNHILQLRELTKKADQLNATLNQALHIAEVRRQHIIALRNILKHVDQHLNQPRERNVPILISAIQRALETTSLYEADQGENK